MSSKESQARNDKYADLGKYSNEVYYDEDSPSKVDIESEIDQMEEAKE